MATQYEVVGPRESLRGFAFALHRVLLEQGFQERAHVSEQGPAPEVWEFVRGAEIVSLLVDDRALDRTSLVLTGEGIDPRLYVIPAAREQILGLIGTFVRPILREPERRRLEESLSTSLADLLGGPQGEATR